MIFNTDGNKSLNLLPFDAILNFGKRKKLRGTELGEFRQYGMTIILFSDRNSFTKHSHQVHHHGGET
jgi:hypothetical protein